MNLSFVSCFSRERDCPSVMYAVNCFILEAFVFPSVHILFFSGAYSTVIVFTSVAVDKIVCFLLFLSCFPGVYSRGCVSVVFLCVSFCSNPIFLLRIQQ